MVVIKEKSYHFLTMVIPFSFYRYHCLPQRLSISSDIAQKQWKTYSTIFLNRLQPILMIQLSLPTFGQNCSLSFKKFSSFCTKQSSRLTSTSTIRLRKKFLFLVIFSHQMVLSLWRKKLPPLWPCNLQLPLRNFKVFLGLVIFYYDMWPRRLYIFAPLTNLLGTSKFK